MSSARAMSTSAVAVTALLLTTVAAQSQQASLVPLDPLLPINEDGVGKPFENVSASVPLTLFLFCLVFAVSYYGNRFWHYSRALEEVDRHLGHAKTQSQTVGADPYAATIVGAPPGTVTMTDESIKATTMTNTSFRRQNTTGGATMVMDTISRPSSSVPYNPAVSTTRTSFRMPGGDSPKTTISIPIMPGLPGPASANTTSSLSGYKFDPAGKAALPPPLAKPGGGLGDTLVEYDQPIFAMPGFLQMDFTNDLRLKGKIAEGGGGVIYKADLVNEDFVRRSGVNNVVVKVLKPLPHMAFAELKTTVFQEIAIMHALITHPNIITLVGFTEEPLSIVTKLYDRNLFALCMAMPDYASEADGLDSLKKFVKPDSKLTKGIIVKGFEMLPEIALHLAWGMASGMAEMHARGILHRDLKSANVLLELKPLTDAGDNPAWMTDAKLESMTKQISGILGQNTLAGGVGWGVDSNGKPYCPVVPIVCDFGLAKMIKKEGSQELNANAVKGMNEAHATGISYRYAAPEAFNRMHHQGGRSEEGRPVDVYAFAVMCWEMLERKVPFHKISNKDLEAKVRAGERPVISPIHRNPAQPHEGNKHYSMLLRVVEACWKQDPLARPTFDECKEKLRPFWLGPKEFALV